MRALKFAASALLMAAAAFGQQTTPYVNPWANAGTPGQGAVGNIGSVSVNNPSFGGGGNVLSGNQVTFTTQQNGASNPSYPPAGPYNPGSATAQNDPYDPKVNQYGNQYGNQQYGGQYGNNQYGNQYGSQYGNQYKPLVDVSPYFNGDCSYSPCLNGGSCYDSSVYAQLSGNTIAAAGQFDTANAGDAESQLSAALAGRQVPNLYSKPAASLQYQKMSWCKCYGPYYGKFCEKRQCDPKQTCSSDPTDQLLVVYPKNVQVECGSYIGPTAAGAGAAIAADPCRQAQFTTADRYETGPQNCPESMMIRRTFTGTDRCGKTSQGTQSIAVVDTKPPKVRAKLVPFPPLAVSASQITLTPEQVKAIVKVLMAVSLEEQKQRMMNGHNNMMGNNMGHDNMMGLNNMMGHGMFLFDEHKMNGEDVNNFLGALMGRDLTGQNMTSIFGEDTASMLMANGFDQQSIMAMLKADPMLSGANPVLGMSPGSMSMLSGMFGSGVANNIAGQVASQRGTPVTIVNVPNDDNNKGGFHDWLMSRVALPVGAQVCSEPTTRVFVVNCTAADKCTPGKRLKAAARLKVTYIVGRRRIGVPDELNDPMFLHDPLKALKGMDMNKNNHMNMNLMDRNMMDQHQQMMRDDLSKKLGVDFNSMANDQKRGNTGIVFNNNIKPLAAGAAEVSSASVAPAATSSGGDAVDLSTLMGNRVMEYDAMLQEGGYTTTSAPYDPKANQYANQYGNRPYGGNGQYDPKNNYGNNQYGNQYGNNQYDPKMADRVNQGADPDQVRAFLGSDDFREQNRGTKVLAFQCKTAVAYVPVHCGDVVSITLDPEDACLAEQFDPMNHTMQMNHVFMMHDFKGDVQKEMRQKGFTDQGFVGRTSFNAIAVRGTAVELQVLAEDECYNVGKGVDEPARDCETFVSGKCCAPVSNGLSQFAINQVLQSQGADQPHFMGSPTMQLRDINFKLP